MLHTISLKVFLYIQFSFENASIPCLKDADCWSKSRPDLHSLYCVDNICRKIVPSGGRCTVAQDCASYFFFGPTACTANCSVQQACENLDTLETTFCCRAVPEGKTCSPDRPTFLNGCDSKQNCSGPDPVCESRGKNAYATGVLLSISGNLLINIGINVQKKSFKIPNLKLFNFEMKTLHFGILVYAMGKCSGFSSYVFGNQSLLASLGAVGLVANSVFAPLINGEAFRWNDFLAIICVLTGSSVIVMHSGRSHKVFSLCELLQMYLRRETICWFSFVALLLASLFFCIKYVEVNSDWGIPNDRFGFLRNEKVFFEETGKVLKYFMLLLYVGLSSVVASLTTLFAKSFGEMVDKSLLGDNQFLYGVTYLFLVLIIVCTFTQIYWLNRALRHYDALLVIPVFHVTWTLFSVLTAGIYFQDFENYTLSQFRGFSLGLLIIVSGSGFLALRIMNKDAIETKEISITKRAVSKKHQ